MMLWILIGAGIWGHCEGTADERFMSAIPLLKGELSRLYDEWSATHKGSALSRLSDLKPRMIGTPSAPTLKLKALETYGFLLFLVSLLDKYGHRVDRSQELLTSGKLLVRYVEVLKESPVKMSPSAVQDRTSQSQAKRASNANFKASI